MAYIVFSSKHGDQAETGMALVHVTGVIIMQAQGVVIITVKLLTPAQDGHIPSVQVEYSHVVVKNVQHVQAVQVM